jgi:tRNA/tmRNA/rRNA uracil-C5-methylase (TrmA/RlmC/RlmD family)
VADSAIGAGLVGARFELVVGPVAHGGHCVARISGGASDGRVVFVRHALPGERVVAVVTEDGGGAYCRADAVEILDASPERVEPPCPHAGPGRCGGCDWQHASADAQRALKAFVVREQFQRLAGLDVAVDVEALPGGLLGWRTRTIYATAADGRLGLRRHRAHEVERLEACPLGTPDIGGPDALARRLPGADGLELAAGDGGDVAVLAHQRVRSSQRGRRPPDQVRLIDGPRQLRHVVAGREFAVASGGFWQIHPHAASTFVDAVLTASRPRAGDTVLDLYAGAGLFTAVLAEQVGPTGRVVGVESDRQAVADARRNLAGLPQASVVDARVTVATLDQLGIGPDIVILDPPRAGAGPDVMRRLARLRPRVIVYVACDPASLARDVAASGARLAGLRAFDAFPMTAHIECVAVLEVPAALS